MTLPSSLPSTNGDLPPMAELAGGNVTTFVPTLSDVILGVPTQEKGIRPARALPYELDVHATVNASHSTVSLTFSTRAARRRCFRCVPATPRIRCAITRWNPARRSPARGTSPRPIICRFTAPMASCAISMAASAPAPRFSMFAPSYSSEDGRGSIEWKITNVGANARRRQRTRRLYRQRDHAASPCRTRRFADELSLDQFYGWYDLIVTVAGDPTFKYRLAGHVETGQDSFSDPALGGLVTLKG